ncbi:hypothetical protein GF312_20270 [Candidatus Poribacteria bacterium]|nr:hypothetical protein [Candidatus Poribacteria bacterium]
MVNREISLSIPEDTSAVMSVSSINAKNIECNLALKDEEKTKNHIKGVLNDGSGRINISNIQGKITIN